ncbi:MAG: hypothetical protein WC815_17095 [Vicinamibacterales bacterium]|jgi:hypothetical protein
MLRHTARLLVFALILGSGRLLACGWECIDELAAPAEASCHQKSAPAGPVLEGGAPHACLPDVIETPVTVAQKAGAASMDPIALAGVPVTIRPGVDARAHSLLRSSGPSAGYRARVTSVLRV